MSFSQAGWDPNPTWKFVPPRNTTFVKSFPGNLKRSSWMYQRLFLRRFYAGQALWHHSVQCISDVQPRFSSIYFTSIHISQQPLGKFFLLTFYWTKKATFFTSTKYDASSWEVVRRSRSSRGIGHLTMLQKKMAANRVKNKKNGEHVSMHPWRSTAGTS